MLKVGSKELNHAATGNLKSHWWERHEKGVLTAGHTSTTCSDECPPPFFWGYLIFALLSDFFAISTMIFQDMTVDKVRKFLVDSGTSFCWYWAPFIIVFIIVLSVGWFHVLIDYSCSSTFKRELEWQVQVIHLFVQRGPNHAIFHDHEHDITIILGCCVMKV